MGEGSVAIATHGNGWGESTAERYAYRVGMPLRTAMRDRHLFPHHPAFPVSTPRASVGLGFMRAMLFTMEIFTVPFSKMQVMKS